MNREQIENFAKTLASIETYGSVTAACFEPKLGVVFFNFNKPVFVIDVCLDCNYLKSSSLIPASIEKNYFIDENVKISRNGFSIQGQTEIINLCKELGLRYDAKKPKSFD